jgi:uncharacterized protein (DUF488 family)
MNLYTLGYEGLGLQEYIDHLLKNGVITLVDVRENPISRKPGFSKNKFSEALNANGIKYTPFYSLGTPRSIRQKFKQDNDWEALKIAYLSHLGEIAEVLQDLVEIVKKEKCCLCCYEADFNNCHRMLIADKIVEITDGQVKVIHLGEPASTG